MVTGTHSSREAILVGMIENHIPHVALHSKAGKSVLGNPVPRIRFDRRIPCAWFWKLFLNAADAKDYGLSLIVTAPYYAALDFTNGFHDIEIHLWDHQILEATERLAAEYRKLTGVVVTIVLESPERVSPRRPILRFLWVVVLLAIAFVGFRLVMLETIRRLFTHFS